MREAGRLQCSPPASGAAPAATALKSRVEDSADVLDRRAADLGDVWEDAGEAGLFQHPAWIREWLATFGGEHLKPLVWLGLDGRGAVQAYSAWSIESRKTFGRAFRRLQPLGSSVWTPDAFPSEHPALADRAGSRGRVRLRDVLDALLEADWDDVVVPYVCVGSEMDAALAPWAESHRLPWVRYGLPNSYSIDTAGSFERYRSSLSANTRRAAFTKRHAAAVQNVAYVPESESVDAGLSTLFELHDARWSVRGMPARGRAFLMRVASRSAPGLRFRVSLLVRNGRPVSARLCATAKRRVYDLQGGFRDAEAVKLSLGKLHLGFDIESCFADRDVDTLDLLAGPGMRSEYKAPFATQTAEVYTFRAGRSALARAVLAARRVLPRRA